MVCYDGFVDVMCDVGFDVLIVVVECDLIEGGLCVVGWLFDVYLCLIVLVVINDLLVIGVMYVVVDCGWCVFDDLLIVGIIDIYFVCDMWFMLMIVVIFIVEVVGFVVELFNMLCEVGG